MPICQSSFFNTVHHQCCNLLNRAACTGCSANLEKLHDVARAVAASMPKGSQPLARVN